MKMALAAEAGIAIEILEIDTEILIRVHQTSRWVPQKWNTEKTLSLTLSLSLSAPPAPIPEDSFTYKPH